MLHRISRSLAPAVLALGLCQGLPAAAQSEASTALSLLPVASVVVAASVGAAALEASQAMPVALSVQGAALSIKAVQSTAKGTVYVLERASDGARASIEVVGRGAAAAAHAVGTVVSCSVIGTGVILSVAGEVLAFVPNALGQGLLYNVRI